MPTTLDDFMRDELRRVGKNAKLRAFAAAMQVHFADEAARLATELRARRQAAGLSQRDLARRSGLSQAKVSAIEAARSDVRVSTIARYLEPLGYVVAFKRAPQPTASERRKSRPRR